jgi:hypothetical protein
MIKSFLFLAGLFGAVLCAPAQKLEIQNVSFDREKLIIEYSLNYSYPYQQFIVAIYSSHDNYQKPINVVGDVGDNVLPGQYKRATWDAKNALPADFDSDINILIKTSRVPAQPLTVKPLEQSTYVKKSTIGINWRGGYQSDRIKIELFKGNKSKLVIADNLNNSYAFFWKMPKIKKAKDYSIRISSPDRPKETPETTSFSVTGRKTGIGKKIFAYTLLGGLAYVAFGDKIKEGLTSPEPALPAPGKPN